MSNSKRWLSIVVGGGLAALLLTGVLMVIPAFAQGPRGGGMMGNYGYNGGMMPGEFGPGSRLGATPAFSGTRPFGFGPGWMMGRFQNGGNPSFGPGWMMGGGMHGMMINSNSPFFVTEPLTLAEASEGLGAYLSELNDDNLEVDDIMVFDNHVYAQIVEKDTGIGVMELLVDPATKAVVPEMGPNMMWNQKYGMMSGFGRHGMMGRGYGFNNRFNATGETVEMPVTPEQAVEFAQTHLDTYFSSANLTVDPHADPFYGYYTLHVNRDGQTVSMLSVNGFTGQVFPHTWHGKLLEMSAE